MGQPHWLVWFVILVAVPCFAATKDADQPDREMLRMMEFLREIEMLKQMELMREMQQVEPIGDSSPRPASDKSSTTKKKEPIR
jgi:hypothetical protein